MQKIQHLVNTLTIDSALMLLEFRVYLFSTNDNICARREQSLCRLVQSSTPIAISWYAWHILKVCVSVCVPVSLGVYDECDSDVDVLYWARHNVFLLYHMGVFTALLELLNMEIEWVEHKPVHSTWHEWLCGSAHIWPRPPLTPPTACHAYFYILGDTVMVLFSSTRGVAIYCFAQLYCRV